MEDAFRDIETRLTSAAFAQGESQDGSHRLMMTLYLPKMTTPRFLSIGSRGSVQPRFLDVVVAVVLLGILLYAATREFPTYNLSAPPAPAAQASR